MRHTSNRQYLQSYILTHVTTSIYVTTISLVENSSKFKSRISWIWGNPYLFLFIFYRCFAHFYVMRGQKVIGGKKSASGFFVNAKQRTRTADQRLVSHSSKQVS